MFWLYCALGGIFHSGLEERRLVFPAFCAGNVQSRRKPHVFVPIDYQVTIRIIYQEHVDSLVFTIRSLYSILVQRTSEIQATLRNH